MASREPNPATDPEPEHSGLDLDAVREVFEGSQDFTIGIEEEFAILRPDLLDLEHRFDQLFAACREDEVLRPSVKGELIDTEIEIRSGRGETFAEATERQRQRRERLFAIADEMGLGLASMGTHPWASYLDQRIIKTEHYQRLARELRWVALRNNTWSLHVHVGIRGADRAIAVCDRMRELLPPLLAASANSPFLDHRDTGLHSARTQIFTRTFPRSGVHQPFGDWATYSDFVELLAQTNSIAEVTQLWWSVRPHHSFGTIEVRICDAQTRGEESTALAALIAACVVQAALDHDERGPGEPQSGRQVEENLWRAIRYGREGKMIDFEGRREVPTAAVIDGVLEWAEPARERIGAEIELPEQNGAQRARQALAEGAPIEEIYREAIEETRRTYAPALAAAAAEAP